MVWNSYFSLEFLICIEMKIVTSFLQIQKNFIENVDKENKVSNKQGGTQKESVPLLLSGSTQKCRKPDACHCLQLYTSIYTWIYASSHPDIQTFVRIYQDLRNDFQRLEQWVWKKENLTLLFFFFLFRVSSCVQFSWA